MGCDIHCYIDWDEFKDRDDKWWVSCFAPNIYLGRNYSLFTLMAGVRYDAETNLYKPLFQPRGLPERYSFNVKDEYALYVTDEREEDNTVSEENVERYIKFGSVWIDKEHRYLSNPDWHSASWLGVAELEQVKVAYEAIPFAQSSWFQYEPPEKQRVPENATVQVIDRPRTGKEWYVQVGEKKTYPVPPSFNAILAAMKVLNNGDNNRTRLVFWFDN